MKEVVQYGCTARNMNYRNREGDLDERIKITAIDPDELGRDHEYLFKCPGLYTSMICDYIALVKAAHPACNVVCEIVKEN